MEVSLKIKQIDISEEYTKILFEYKGVSFEITDSVTFVIPSLHELFFGYSKLKIKTKGFPWEYYVGVVWIKNSIFINETNSTIKLNILHRDYNNKTDFYDFNGLKTVGEFTGEFVVKYIQSENEEYKKEEENFITHVFGLFLNQKKSLLLYNFKRLVEDFLEGSHVCKINFMLGIAFLEKFTSEIHYANTRSLLWKNLKGLRYCDIKPTHIFKSRKYGLEYFLLGRESGIMYKPIRELLNDELLDEKISSDTSISNKEDTGDLYLVKSNVEEYFDLNNTDDDELENREVLDIFKDLINPMINSINIEDQESNETNMYDIKHKNEARQSACSFRGYNLDLEKLNTFPSNKKSIRDILSNKDYVICPKEILSEIINYYYFAIGSYANTWPTIFCERRRRLDKNECYDNIRRSILEYLDIENSNLLSVAFDDEEVPDHIIFIDKIKNRLVVSFKGSTSSDDALKDLDCRYTNFFDGYTHKGIRNLAYAFVEKKTSELLKYAERAKIKDILFTGHSLGGSISILLHIIYKNHELFKSLNISTVVFSPAPVVSYNMTRNIYRNLFVINYGNDFVTRLNYGSFCELKYTACSLGNYSRFCVPLNDIEESMATIRNQLRKEMKYPKLYFPGSIYHFKRIDISRNKQNISCILYKRVDVSFFEYLLITKHITMHHIPGHFLKVFNKGIIDYDRLDIFNKQD